MWWLIVPAVLYFGREHISRFLAPILPDQSRQIYWLLFGQVVMTLLFLLPLHLVLPQLAAFKRTSYMMSMWFSVAANALQLTVNLRDLGVQFPDTSGFSIRNAKQSFQDLAVKMQPFLVAAMQSPDFTSLFFTVIFLTAPPAQFPFTYFPPLILARRSIWSLGQKADKNSSIGSKMSSMYESRLKARTEQASHLTVGAEIALGFGLAVCILLPTRQVLTTFLYWQYLQMRYRTPTRNESRSGSRPIHAKVWDEVGQKADPLLTKVPILNTPVNYVKNMFQQQR